MSKISTEISRSIKEKWLEIEYDGNEGVSNFWIAINDIISVCCYDIFKIQIKCDAFNLYKFEMNSGGFQSDFKIYYENIGVLKY